MNYNERFFNPETNLALSIKIKGLICKQGEILNFLKTFLLSTDEQVQLENCRCFLELAIKIRFNLESTTALLPKLTEDYRFKTGLNLLYRCIVDDLINIFYLSGFVVLNSQTQPSLNNELNILHKEFLSSALIGIEADNDCQVSINELMEKSPSNFQAVLPEIIEANPELFNNNKFKKNKELRLTSNQQLKQRTERSNNSPFISENEKTNFIKDSDEFLANRLLALFKYFSQYQHFSPKMHQFVLSDARLEIVQYEKTLFLIFEMLDLCSKFIKFNDIEKIKAKLDNLITTTYQADDI